MTPPQPLTAPGTLLGTLQTAFGPEPIRHVEYLPPRPGRAVDWPDWVPGELIDALRSRGVDRPWAHQAAAAEIAHGGGHVVIATGTASGKSLAYQLPALTAMLTRPKACALYLSPTKALAADQLESLESLGLAGVRASPYDGDTPQPERDWARDHGRFLLTNPDMVHLGIVPYHARWARLLRNLAYLIVDECHSYRGVFGSHVALVLRRLRRIARYYGSDPVVILASATVAEPAAAAARLIGAPVAAVTDDAAPHPGAAFVLWEPPLLPSTKGPAGRDPATTDAAPAHAPHREVRGFKADFFADSDAEIGFSSANQEGGDADPLRRSAPAEAARIAATLIAAGARTLTFVRSRAGAEQVAVMTARALQRTHPALAAKVSAYRGGYLPEDRRALERAFDSGELVGVASTNALELGVDIAGIDAAVLAGYPGTLASLWQQAGRAGRGGEPALVAFVARDDPLDSYLVHHPEAVFGQPVEAAVIDPGNPHVLGPQLLCAAAEMRLTDEDLDFFGGDAARSALAELVAAIALRQRPGGYFHTGRLHPAGTVSLRGSGQQVAIVEGDTGRLLGTEDTVRACASLHPGAVYVHRGETFLVRELDLDGGVALVDADRPDWWTSARSASEVEIVAVAEQRVLPGGVMLATGPVRVTEQVTGYLRRRGDGTLIDAVDLDMPEHILDTRAVWYTIDGATLQEALRAAGRPEMTALGALHAAEHAAIGLLPLFAGCDRWDIGGLSTALHADTGEPTVIIYDGYHGSAGFAERGHAVARAWLTATRDAIAACPCATGCPSCVQSPKCGSGNHPLDKAGAAIVLGAVINALATNEDHTH